VWIGSKQEAEAVVRAVERLIGEQLRSEEGVLIDADSTGGFNVNCSDARSFAVEWACAFEDAERSKELHELFGMVGPTDAIIAGMATSDESY